MDTFTHCHVGTPHKKTIVNRKIEIIVRDSTCETIYDADFNLLYCTFNFSYFKNGMDTTVFASEYNFKDGGVWIPLFTNTLQELIDKLNKN